MELQNYVAILKRRRWIIGLTMVAAIAVVIAGMMLIKPSYTAEATLRVSPRSSNLDYGLLEYAVRLKNTYAQLAVSGPALQELQQRFGIEKSVGELRESISVEFPSNNEMMSVMARNRDPVAAAAIANGVSILLVEESQRSRSGRTFTIEQIQPASVPTRAETQSMLVVIAFGVIASLGAGLGLALLLESTDSRVYTTAQVAELVQLPVVANIPRVAGRARPQCYNGTTAAGESFRQLRANLAALGSGDTAKTIVVTSAETSEGKSLVAANLAYTLTQLGRRVVVIDGDMRLPTLHKFFGADNQAGLGDLLRRDAELDDVIRFSDSHKLHIITSGNAGSNPADLLSTPELATRLQQLAERFDIIILDTPAYLAVADATILTKLADNVLFVVRYGWSQRESVRRAYDLMALADVPLVGVVVNGAERSRSYTYYQKPKK